MASRKDIEEIDVEVETESASTRALLRMLKSMLLQLIALIEELRTDNAELKQALFGRKSERQPRAKPPKKQPLSREEADRRHKAGQAKRQKTREQKAALPTETIEHPAPADCPACESVGPFDSLPPETSFEYECVPAHVIRREHIRERRICSCGQIFTGPPPKRVGDCAHYGPGLHADAVVSKCADAMPINRLAKRYQRAFIPLAKSTLNDLFHRSADLLEPIHHRLRDAIVAAKYVNADETTQPVMDTDKCRRGYMWTFIAGDVVLYEFSPSRSGETPAILLADSTGVLQVDGYTGYNSVTTPDKRTRAGCLAHARRYFVKAQSTCPDECEVVLDKIRQLYRVEYEAAKRDVLGTAEHLLLRKVQSKPVMKALGKWLDEQKPLHVPKSPMGKAISYTQNQWEFLLRFLSDPKIALDNNISERALRVVARGRDNFRWVGSNQAGRNLAILQSIVATCIASGVNPQAYLTDVLIRVAEHPAKRIDELLPMNWQPP